MNNEKNNNVNMVMVHKQKKDFTAIINGKEIKMTFEELGMMERLFYSVLNDYTGVSYAAYEDKGEIVLVTK